jgi:hypothetical protein
MAENVRGSGCCCEFKCAILDDIKTKGMHMLRDICCFVIFNVCKIN